MRHLLLTISVNVTALPVYAKLVGVVILNYTPLRCDYLAEQTVFGGANDYFMDKKVTFDSNINSQSIIKSFSRSAWMGYL